jgi:hypothetical protein
MCCVFWLKFIAGNKDATVRWISKEHTKSAKHNTLTAGHFEGINAGAIFSIIGRLDSLKATINEPITLGPHNITTPAPYLLAQ